MTTTERLLERKKEIVSLYQKHKDCRLVANELGFSKWAVWTFLKKYTDLCRKTILPKSEIDKMVKEYVNEISSIKQLSVKYNLEYGTVLHELKINGAIIRPNYIRKHEINKDFFKQQSNQMLWVLGLMFSDGNVSKSGRGASITLHSNDVETLEKICRIVGGCVRKPKGRNIHVLDLNSKEIGKDLVALGCVPAKSLIIEYPKILKTDEQHWSFLRGVVDGDGHVGKYKIEIASGSEKFLKSIALILKSRLKLETNIIKTKNSKCSKLIIWGGIRASLVFGNALYSDSIPETRMNRKYEAYLKLKEKVSEIAKKREFPTFSR